MDGPDGARRNLDAVRSALLRLHKTLLESESAAYDRDIQRISNRQKLLELVMHDPWFAWLRELSGLVILIDEALEGDPPPTPSDAGRFLAQTRALLAPEETGAGFGKRYYEALQRDPDVVIAHGAAMALLRTLE